MNYSKILSKCNVPYPDELRNTDKDCIISPLKPTILPRYEDNPLAIDRLRSPANSKIPIKTERDITDRIWFDNPAVLIEKWDNFVPRKGMTTAETLNALMRFALYFFLIMIILKASPRAVFAPLLVGLATVIIYKNIRGKDEFLTSKSCENFTQPTPDNPFMNTLVTEYGVPGGTGRTSADNPEKPGVKKDIEYLFNQNLYKDADDLYNKRNSQNRFFTMPDTSEFGMAAGDTVKFANWLYNRGVPTCKEDTKYCIGPYAKGFNTYDNLRAHRQILVPYEAELMHSRIE